MEQHEMAAASRDIAEKSERMLRKHEIEDHEGLTCRHERVNLIAFLAHRLGVRSEGDALMFLHRLADYELGHEEHTMATGHARLH